MKEQDLGNQNIDTSTEKKSGVIIKAIVDHLSKNQKIGFIAVADAYPKTNLSMVIAEQTIIVAPQIPITRIDQFKPLINEIKDDLEKDPMVGEMNKHEPYPGGTIWFGGLVKKEMVEGKKIRVLVLPEEILAGEALDRYNQSGSKEEYEGIYKHDYNKYLRRMRKGNIVQFAFRKITFQDKKQEVR